jgi:predicted hydrocarbon binding protein
MVINMQETAEELANRIRNNPGKVKAEVMRIEKEYILEREGEEGISKLKERMKELGADIDFIKLESLTWEEEWKNSLMVVVSKEIFNWTEEDVFEMGRYSPRASFFIKSIIQYLVSVETVFDNMGKYWDKHHDFGALEAVELNLVKKYLVIRKKGFFTHPLMCIYYAGYFKGVAEFVIKSNNINIEETKCMHKGDEYHEYKISWD